MGIRVFPESDGLALLANTIATGAALAALIMTFGPISGAHFNPVVSIADASQGGLAWREVPAYVGAQILGGLLGTLIAHGMFAQPAWFEASTRIRAGGPQLLSELVASFGLLSVISGCARSRAETVPFAVAAYITSAYWFTASTSFANPAVTIARAFTNTFSGIRPADVPAFIAAQCLGGALATKFMAWLAASRKHTP
jgi:glycerol uptake facilitator-like aquaporin